MRRVLFAVAGLAAGTTLLVVLKTGPAATPVAGAARTEATGRPAAAPTAAAPGPARATGAAPTGAATDPGRSGTGPSAGSRPTRPRATAHAPAPGRSSAAPKAPTGPRTLYGSVVKAPGYGNVQVQITVSGRTVTAVKAIELPFDTPTSEQKSASVRQRYETKGEALAYATGRSARLDAVSGATETSAAYRGSLQSALDQR
ncbi:FMN-binding protein [Plantactinospora siamensis]|uniref:FMN-binding protein n=1 Tax=Plantactinospora siamensis TaxID=555372 RepID=A0ABV6P285_9ACTN